MPKFGPRPKSLELRFWPKVEKGDRCWKWTAGKDKDGYGKIRMSKQRRMLPAHRASWIIHHGSIPDGMWVLHDCDNPECTNPDHLYLGNQIDNLNDMFQRGRDQLWLKGHGELVAGEKNFKSRLTWAEVDEIRYADKLGIPRKDIQTIYGVSKSTGSYIVNNLSWKEHHRPTAMPTVSV